MRILFPVTRTMVALFAGAMSALVCGADTENGVTENGVFPLDFPCARQKGRPHRAGRAVRRPPSRVLALISTR